MNMLMRSVRVIHFLSSYCIKRNIEANNIQIPQLKWAKLPFWQFLKFDFKKINKQFSGDR